MRPKNAGWHYQRAYIIAKRPHLVREERIGERAMARSRGRLLDAQYERYVKLQAEARADAA